MTPEILSLLVAAGCAGVEVRLSAERLLDIQVQSVPITRVLECVSEAAGFRIIAETEAVMGQSVTISLSRKTTTQAIDALLAGAPFNYAYTTDPAGSRILVLMLMPKSASGSGGATPPAPARATGTSRVGQSKAAVEPGTPAGVTELLDRPGPEAPKPEEPSTRGVLPRAPAPRAPASGLAPVVPALPSMELYPEPHPLSPLSLRGAQRVLPGNRN